MSALSPELLAFLASETGAVLTLCAIAFGVLLGVHTGLWLRRVL
jgi:hypothetical protein